jgi:hypothetical protein
MTYNPDATPAQYANYTNNEVIEKGSAVRCKLIGLRNELGGLFAIGKMSADFFGYATYHARLGTSTDMITVQCDDLGLFLPDHHISSLARGETTSSQIVFRAGFMSFSSQQNQVSRPSCSHARY